MMTFEVRHWITDHEADIEAPGPQNVGVIFYGSKGYIAVWSGDSGEYHTWLGREQAPGFDTV